MTPHQTLAVAVRLFAILLAIYAVRELLTFYSAGRGAHDAYVLLIVSVASVLAVCLLMALWFFPKTIARGLLPLSTDTPAQASAPDLWIAIGSSLIGLWLAATAIPALMRNSLLMYVYRSEAMDKTPLVDGLLYYAVQFVVGAALILGANGVKNFISWARTTGTGEPSNSVVESDAHKESRAPHDER